MNTFTFEERRDRARAYATLLRQRLVVLRAALARRAPVRPVVAAEVARAAARVQVTTALFAAALDADSTIKAEWRRAELDCARLLLAIERQDPTPVRLAA